MPEIHNYIVTQSREVHVTARSAADALKIAEAAFSHGQNAANGVIEGPAGVWGNTSSRVSVTSFKADKIR